MTFDHYNGYPSQNRIWGHATEVIPGLWPLGISVSKGADTSET